MSTWSGQLFLDVGWALFAGRPGDNELHAHHAIQISASAEAPLRLQLGSHATVVAPIAAVGAGVEHRIEDGGGPLTLLYIEPESRAGRAVAAGLTEAATRELSLRLRLQLNELATVRANPVAARDELLACFGAQVQDEPGRAIGDPRVVQAIAWISAELSSGPIPVASLSAEVGISASRLSKLFRRDTGIAIRAYVRWARLRRALTASAAGRNITEAAHVAGFSDTAHLARTFRRMFGTTISSGVSPLEIHVGPF